MTREVSRRIGLFGGSFDPVHDAHVALAHIALEHLKLDELRWIPAGRPWQKHGPQASPEDRAAMVQLAIADEPRFVLERCELDREGPSYTLDTVVELQAREPGAEWFLVIGQDQYANLPSWHGWQELVARVVLAVANRAGDAPQAGSALRAEPHRMVELPLPATPLSSTALRDALAGDREIAGMVPKAVARYIADHHLYPRTH